MSFELYLESNRQKHLSELFELLKIPSISAQQDHYDDCMSCARKIADKLESIGLEAKVDASVDRPLVFASSQIDPDRPTLLIYGHYDVQPPEPLEKWSSGPFEPEVRDGYIYARGSSDDKGQMYTWIMAAEAIKNSDGIWPVNLKFLIEGEEETSSASLDKFIAANTELLKCDFVAVSDTSFYDDNTPAITYGLRGIACMEVTLTGPDRDLHSGLYGGIAPNPIGALVKLLATLHDDDGLIAIDGIYNDEIPPTTAELAMWEKLSASHESLAAEMGCLKLFGPEKMSIFQRNWATTCLDCNGIYGGYSGQGVKTVIPSQAGAKLSMRLAAGQSAKRAIKLLAEHLGRNCPVGFKLDLKEMAAEDPWVMDFDSPALAAGAAAMTKAFGKDCALIRNGASIPVAVSFNRLLGRDPVLMGYGLASDNIHSPNESLKLEHFYAGAKAAGYFMQNILDT